MHQTEAEIKDELEIIQLAKKKPEVFGILYERHYKKIFLFVCRRVDGQETAGDLTSQIFLKALLKLPEYVFKGLPFSAWLYRIASNQVNEYFRGSKNRRSISLDDCHIDALFEEAETETEDRTQTLVELLNSLETDEVELLELRFFEGHSFKEVAYILDITENNAKVRTYRVIDKLKKIALSRKL